MELFDGALDAYRSGFVARPPALRRSLRNQGRWKEATSEFRKAIAQNPGRPALALPARSVLRRDTADFESARKEFQAELALNPLDVAAEYYLGDIDLAKINRRRGRTLRAALKLHAQFARRWLSRSAAKLRCNKWRKLSTRWSERSNFSLRCRRRTTT